MTDANSRMTDHAISVNRFPSHSLLLLNFQPFHLWSMFLRLSTLYGKLPLYCIEVMTRNTRFAVKLYTVSLKIFLLLNISPMTMYHILVQSKLSQVLIPPFHPSSVALESSPIAPFVPPSVSVIPCLPWTGGRPSP
jgi:hypothetical protein